MSTYIKTVIGGGGQAELAISYYLSQEGREHVVLRAVRESSAKPWSYAIDISGLVHPCLCHSKCEDKNVRKACALKPQT